MCFFSYRQHLKSHNEDKLLMKTRTVITNNALRTSSPFTLSFKMSLCLCLVKMKGVAEKTILCLMEEGGFYGFTNICTILHFFFLVCVCVCDEHRKKLWQGK